MISFPVKFFLADGSQLSYQIKVESEQWNDAYLTLLREISKTFYSDAEFVDMETSGMVKEEWESFEPRGYVTIYEAARKITSVKAIEVLNEPMVLRCEISNGELEDGEEL